MPSDYNQFMDQILAQKQGSLEGIRKQIDERRGVHDSFIDKVNLAPAAAFVDAMTGSNMAQSFRGPTPHEKNQQVIMALENALARGESELAGRTLGAAKNEAFLEQTKSNMARADQDREFNRWLQTEKLNIAKNQGPAGGMKAPPHYRFTETGDLEPIPGGKADREIREAEAKKARQKEQTDSQAGTAIQDLGRALTLVQDSPGSFGPLSGRLGLAGHRVKENKTGEAAGHIKSALSNIGFDQLNQMRQSSPTGGALGNVTEKQLEQLNSVLGRLDVTDPDHVLEENLKRAQNVYNDIVHGRGHGPRRHVLSFDDQGRPMTDEKRAMEEARMDALFGTKSAAQVPEGKVMIFDPQSNKSFMINSEDLESALADGAIEVK
jgi:hypothetical protein